MARLLDGEGMLYRPAQDCPSWCLPQPTPVSSVDHRLQIPINRTPRPGPIPGTEPGHNAGPLRPHLRPHSGLKHGADQTE